MLSRREFIKQLVVMVLCASPLGAWAYKKWKEHQARKQMFSQVHLPLIRKVFPELMAKDLVSVQPMTMPTAQMFYMDFKYNEPRRPRDNRGRIIRM